MTERPHILPPPPGGGALRRPEEPGAAFFDLDRTLMAGSSAFAFAREAYRSGLMSRRQIVSGARILATLVHELRRRGGGYGCAAICSGGGQGDAVIVQV